MRVRVTAELTLALVLAAERVGGSAATSPAAPPPAAIAAGQAGFDRLDLPQLADVVCRDGVAPATRQEAAGALTQRVQPVATALTMATGQMLDRGQAPRERGGTAP